MRETGGCEVGLGLATAVSMGRTLLAVRRQEEMGINRHNRGRREILDDEVAGRT